MKKYTFFFIFLLFVAGTRYATAQGIIYVDSSRTSGANNGNDWANAYTSLQSALSAATPADTIWIARGTYYPSHNSSGTATSGRDATFHINKDSLQLYGGFAGTETSPEGRDIAANPTILSGDIGIAGNNSDNCYHVLYLNVATSSENIQTATRLEGLIVKDGNANGSSPDNNGGGIYLFSSSFDVTCSPSFYHCSFSGNNASTGGAVYNEALDGGTCSPLFTNCSFSGNNAGIGGAVSYTAIDGFCTSIFTNCTFAGNNTPDFGGAIYNVAASFELSATVNPVLRNSIIMGNSSGIYNVGDEATVTATYSLVQDFFSFGEGNIDADGITAADVFADPVDPTSAPTSLGDYRLISTSPVIDMGSDSLYEIADGLPDNNSLDNDTDLGGNPRLDGAAIDMGAFESAIPLPVSWQRFTASKENDQVLLDWITLTEQNNRGFTIEHSSNAAQWQPIAFTPSKAPNGNSTQSTRYSFRHQDPQNGPNYYRLRQEDIDGRYSYSAVRSVLFTGQSKLNLYPNPAGNYITIDGLAGNESIRITDITGSTLYQTKTQATQLRISLQQLAGGIYYIHLGEQNEAAYRFTVVK